MSSGADNIAASLSKQTPNATKRGGQATRLQNGLFTPEGTPEPDVGRNKAGEAKKKENENTEGTPEPDEEPNQGTKDDEGGFATTREQPPDADDDGAEGNSSAVAGTDLIQQVLGCGSGEPRKVLGIQEKYDDPYQEEEAVLTALWDRGMELHPLVNKHKDADKAFKMILEAAAALEADDEQIQEVKEWEPTDGEQDEDAMDGVEKELPRPHKIIEQIYQEATPHFAQLQKAPKSKAAAKQLDILNDRIKKQNEKDGVEPSDQWILRYQEFVDIYQKARPAIDRAHKNPNDDEAKKELEEHSKVLADIIKRNHYLNWNINLDIAAPAASQVRTRKGTKSSEPARPTPSPTDPMASTSTENATQKHAEPADSAPKLTEARDENQTKSTDSTNVKGSQVTAPARSQAAQNIQSETLNLWAHMGWAVHKMADGDIILSHKALCREGKDPYAYRFTVMTQESPYFQIKLGSEIGQQEMGTYLAMPNIYKIKTDPGDNDTPVYTYRDKSNYVRLLWTATKPRIQTQAGKRPMTGDTDCCVLWKNGKVAEMARSHFKKVTTDNEMKAIEKYCKSVDIKAPWDMDPKNLTVSANSSLGQQLLQAGRNGSAMSLGSSKVENPNADIPSSGWQESIAALQTSLQAMDSKFEKNQMMLQEQLKKQQDLQAQMQQQQNDLQSKLMALLEKLSS